MKKRRVYLSDHKWPIVIAVLAVFILGSLLLYRLGSLTGGLSIVEEHTATTAYGWRGIYHQSLYLPLNVLRSIIFKLDNHFGQTLTRLPNALFGGLAIITFAILLWEWHGTRTAIFGTILFASSAWTLHVSRLASYDILYLWAVPTLLIANILLHHRSTRAVVFYGTILLWGLLLYIPGLIWLVVLNIIWRRAALRQGWNHCNMWWQRVFAVLVSLIWLPLLIFDLTKPGNFRTWLGFPRFVRPESLIKQFIAVPVHLFIRGPEYPQLWLARAPLLDVFTFVVTILGVYFYARHYNANRSRLLGCYFGIGWLLVALGGPVGLSVLVPIVYLCAAAGIAFLIREWLQVFPTNPLARSLGLGLIIITISLSSLYNLRAYFVAWPNNVVTQSTFHYHR